MKYVFFWWMTNLQCAAWCNQCWPAQELKRLRNPTVPRLPRRILKEKIDAMAVDMSLSGLLAQSPRVIPAGAAIELSIILPDTNAAVKIKAKILRIVGKDRPAILFQGMVQDDRDALHQFMLPLILAEIGREAS